MLPIKKIKLAIEAFFYKARFNIVLHNVLNSSRHQKMESKIEQGIYKQILYFAKAQKVRDIIESKKVNKSIKSTDKEILKKVIMLWVVLSTFVPETDFYSYLEWTAQKGGQSALDKLKSKENFDLKNKAFLGKIKSRSKKVIRLVDKTTQNWIARTIKEGLKKKLSYKETARLLKDAAKNMARERAETIAENEAALILGEIEYEVYKKNNIQFHTWITARDELVCKVCLANEEAGKVKVGDVFPSGVLFPPAHIRCRCLSMPIIPANIKISWKGQ